MIQILIVDDQEEIIRGIQSGINWGQIPEIHRVFRAQSTVEAQKIFRENTIDLLVTDIEMPGENGLELVSWVNQNYPEVRSILLTAHAKFQYARDAVRLHCVDYILQPVRYDLLQQAIENAVTQCMKDRALQEDIQVGAYWNTHREKLAQKTWEDFLYDRENASADLHSQLDSMDICLNAEDGFGLLIVYHKPQGEGLDEWNSQTAIHNVEKQLSSYLSAYSNYQCSFVREPNRISLLFATELPEKDIRDALQAFSAVSQEALSIYFSFGQNLNDLPKLYQELENDFRRLLVPKPGFFHRDTLEKEKPGEMPVTRNWCNYFENNTTQLIIDSIGECVRRNMKKGTMNRATIYAMQQAFLYAFQESLRKRSLTFADLMVDPEVQGSFSHSLRSVSEFLSFVQLIAKKNKTLPIVGAKPPEDAVELAKAFISDHLAESDLSRQDISMAAHVSEGHLSHLFSKKMGISITDYISMERLKLAKSLLADTTMPITWIAMKSGFNSTSYFISSFKKFTGSTPTEYRKESRSLRRK